MNLVESISRIDTSGTVGAIYYDENAIKSLRHNHNNQNNVFAFDAEFENRSW